MGSGSALRARLGERFFFGSLPTAGFVSDGIVNTGRLLWRRSHLLYRIFFDDGLRKCSPARAAFGSWIAICR